MVNRNIVRIGQREKMQNVGDHHKEVPIEKLLL